MSGVQGGGCMYHAHGVCIRHQQQAGMASRRRGHVGGDCDKQIAAIDDADDNNVDDVNDNCKLAG